MWYSVPTGDLYMDFVSIGDLHMDFVSTGDLHTVNSAVGRGKDHRA